MANKKYFKIPTTAPKPKPNLGKANVESEGGRSGVTFGKKVAPNPHRTEGAKITIIDHGENPSSGGGFLGKRFKR